MQVDVKFGPSVLNEVKFEFIGPPGLLGGSNYGSCLVDDRIFVLNVNEDTLGNSNLNLQAGYENLGTFFPKPVDWYPLTQNDWTTIVPFTNTKSFITGYDFVQNTVDWEVSVLPASDDSTSYPHYTTQCNISCNKDLVFVHGANGRLYVKRTQNGVNVTSLDLLVAGNANAILLKDNIYICSGRNLSATGTVGSGLGLYSGGTQYMYSFKS
jgi:hypothetical protein